LKNKIKIAVLITCHNRLKKTKQCLKALFSQRKTRNVNLEVFLVDDGSVDGTTKYVANNYPSIHLLKGDGNLYWGGGMFVAWENALKFNIKFNYFLWLNDDVELYKDAIFELLNSPNNKKNITVGSLRDPSTKKRSYGGAIFEKKLFRPFKYKVVDVNGKYQKIDTFNGNVVLISRYSYDKIGKFDKFFHHIAGDTDYSLRARKANIEIYLTKFHIGTCTRSKSINKVKLSEDIFNPKSLTPKVWFRFCYKYGGFFWLFYFFYRFVRLIFFKFYNKK